MQAAAKQFRGDFFVAIDQPVGKFVRIEAPFLNGDVGVRGDAIAMPAVRNGRKGLVIRLVKLDADSLGIPIQEQTKELSLDEEDEDPADEFAPQATVASNVSAAVAKSIRAHASAADRAPPVKITPAPMPVPASRAPAQPIPLEDLDDDTREAVDEFNDVSTRASAVPADLARALAEPAMLAVVKTVRRTPEGGIPVKPVERKREPTPPPPAAAVDDGLSFDSPTKTDNVVPPKQPARLDALMPDQDDKPVPAAKPEREPEDLAVVEPAPALVPVGPSKAATTFLVVLIVIAIAAAAFFLIQGL